jgi:hypothetical protein
VNTYFVKVQARGKRNGKHTESYVVLAPDADVASKAAQQLSYDPLNGQVIECKQVTDILRTSVS